MQLHMFLQKKMYSATKRNKCKQLLCLVYKHIILNVHIRVSSGKFEYKVHNKNFIVLYLYLEILTNLSMRINLENRKS